MVPETPEIALSLEVNIPGFWRLKVEYKPPLPRNVFNGYPPYT
jgi:hypothetical protein